MVDLLKLANTVMEILDRQPRENPRLTDFELLSIVKEYTDDNTLDIVSIHDAVSYLELQRAVYVDRNMGTSPPDFDHVRISRIGRINFQLNRDWPIPKESLREKPSQEIRIDKVTGDVQISLSGINIKLISNSFQELKERIRTEDMLSEKGKKEIIENVEILEEEAISETPNKGRAQRAYDWIKEKSPPFVKELVVNLIANLIAHGIVTAS